MIKSSGIDESIYKGIKKAIQIMYQNPKTTLGVAGSLILAKKLADNIHPAHQIFRGETNNTLMKDQNSTLKQILQEVKSEVPKNEYIQRQKISPLT